MIKLTEPASTILQSIIADEMEKDPSDKLYVRLSMGIGWGGPELKLSLEEQPLSKDISIAAEGITLLIHEDDAVYFQQTKLDYVTDPLGRKSFKILHV